MEIKKLECNSAVDPILIEPELLNLLNERVERYCHGLFESKEKEFIEERQKS